MWCPRQAPCGNQRQQHGGHDACDQRSAAGQACGCGIGVGGGVQVDLACEQVGVIACGHGGGDGAHALGQRGGQGGLELALGHAGDRHVGACNVQLQPGVFHGAVVARVVQVERDFLSVKHAHQLKQVGGGGKARQGCARCGGGGFAMVMACASQRGRR